MNIPSNNSDAVTTGVVKTLLECQCIETRKGPLSSLSHTYKADEDRGRRVGLAYRHRPARNGSDQEMSPRRRCE